MKCEHCGFISNFDFDTCPYCGRKADKDPENVFHSSIRVGQNQSVSLRSLLTVVFLNAFAIALIIDALFSFKYLLTIGAYFVCIGSVAIISILYRSRSPISTFERLYAFILVGAMLTGLLLGVRFHGEGDNPFNTIGLIGVPALICIGSITSIFFLCFGRGQKFRPLATELLLIVCFAISVTAFVFLIVNDKSGGTMLTFMSEGILAYKTPAYRVMKGVIIANFFVTVFFFANFNVILASSLISKVKYIYGQ